MLALKVFALESTELEFGILSILEALTRPSGGIAMIGRGKMPCKKVFGNFMPKQGKGWSSKARHRPVKEQGYQKASGNLKGKRRGKSKLEETCP